MRNHVPYLVENQGENPLVRLAIICDYTITEAHQAELLALAQQGHMLVLDAGGSLVITSSWLRLFSQIADEVRHQGRLVVVRNANEGTLATAQVIELPYHLFAKQKAADMRGCLYPGCEHAEIDPRSWLCPPHYDFAVGWFEATAGSHIAVLGDVEHWIDSGCPYRPHSCWRFETVSDYACALPSGHHGACDDGRGNVPRDDTAPAPF